MAIRGSILQSVYNPIGGGYLNSGNGYSFSRIKLSIALSSASNVNKTQSFPAGYKITDAIRVPMIDGGMAGKASFLTEVSTSIIGVGFINGVSEIVITVSTSGNLLASINGSSDVLFTDACELMGIAYGSGNADISARPTAADIAGETWAIRLDGDYTARDLMQVMASVLAGKTNITDLGAGNATVAFRNISDTADKIDATMNGSERTEVSIN
jgi:hypothetical protein